MSNDEHVPTIDDLRVKLCYICREEELADGSHEPTRGWTHPCSCTLIAHESCLLHWIKAAQQDPARAGKALQCPQCGAKYELESDNPWILRLLDNINQSLSICGKVVSIAGFTGVIMSVGFGIYVICTSYGAYAVHEFLGRDMYQLLLTDDPSNWPWHAFINLPLIPFSLILSRTSLLDSLPIVPLFLAWPSSQPVVTADNMLVARWNASRAVHPILAWPPSPLMATFLFPLLSSLYRRQYERAKHWVLGTSAAQRTPVSRVVWALNEDGPAQFRVRIGADFENEDQAQQQQQPREEEVAAEDPAVVAERTLRVTNASLGRFVGGALMLPAIANAMGALLFRLARHSRLLRGFLAVRPRLGDRMMRGEQWIAPGPADWEQMGYLKQLGMGARVALNLVCGGSRVWVESDPVWWRNSVGLGVFIVAKDCIKLLHLWLKKRELETRRIKSRSFAGVDIKELDLIPREVEMRHPPVALVPPNAV